MKTILICFLIVFSFFQASWSQQKVYMPFPEIINIEGDYQYSLSKLFQKYVGDQKKYEIILPEWKNEPYPTESNEVTRSKALEAGAPYYLKGNLNALGDLIIVTMSMFRTDDGKEIWNALLKGANMGDLDPILKTCAKNLGEKNVTTTSNDIYTVSQQEGKELTEIETKICAGLLLGGFYPFGQPVTAGLGFLTTYDNRTIIYGLDVSFFSNKENSEDHIAITIDHPLSSSANTAYLGGGLGYSTIHLSDISDPYSPINENNGLMLLAGGGFIINRSSSVRLIFGGRLMIPFFKVNDKILAGVNFYAAVNISKRAKRKRTIDANINN